MDYLISTVENNIGRLTTEDENGNNFLLYEEELSFPYPTVTIGNQVWTSVNIYFDDGNNDIYKQYDYIVNKYNFGDTYFYKRTALSRIEQLYPDYRIPTDDDVNILKSYVNNNAVDLKSIEGWSRNPGTNSLGFNGQPIGYFETVASKFRPVSKGNICAFYTTSHVVWIDTNNTFMKVNLNNNYIPVRLIKR